MIIVDDAIKDKDLLLEIRESESLFPPPKTLDHGYQVNLMDGQSERTPVDYLFWEGWSVSPANTLKKRIIENIWKRFLPFPEEDLYGIEYWTRTFLPGQYSGWHVDQGFCLCEPGGYGGPPRSVLGGIYYPIKGKWEESYIQIRYDDCVETVPAKQNRLVIFESADVYHRSTPTKTETRYSMPMNLWSKKNPPTGLKNFSINYEN